MNDPSPTRILVIDDDPAILTLFQVVLEKAYGDWRLATGALSYGKPENNSFPSDTAPHPGICIDTAASGAAGIELLQRACLAGRPYFIAFVDLLMPEMNGIETTRRLFELDPSLLVATISSSENALLFAELSRVEQSDRLLSLRKPLSPVEIRQVVRFMDRRKRAENAFRRRKQELYERVKELQCLHAVAKLLDDTELLIPDVLAFVAETIPSGFQRPGSIVVRLVVRDRVYTCGDFRETPWTLASPILVEGQGAGALEVCSLDGLLPNGAGPFLNEELALVESIAIQVGDFISRREAEESLCQSEERYRALFECSQDAIMVFDVLTDKFTVGNSATHELFGVADEEQFMLLEPSDLSPEYQPDGRRSAQAAKAMIDRAVREGSAFFEWQHKRLDGTEFPTTVLLTRIELAGRVLVQATVRDISAQKRMQAELAQAHRLEAIGQLAAGIAHEINTPTQYIGDNTRFLGDAFRDIHRVMDCVEQLLAAEDPPDTKLLDRLRIAAKAADLRFLAGEIPQAITQSLEGVQHVAKIVRAMKEFSHPGGEGKTAVDLNRIVESTLTVCRNEWKYVAEMVTDFDPALPPVPCLPAELNQAILNIVINAAHAIAEKVGESGEKGIITVRTRSDGDAAEIRIEDTGTGIPDHLRSRIFDLFFTTKAPGQGTGQGLTMAQAIIIEKHGGTIECQSEPGIGTTFIIRLPLEPAADARTARCAARFDGHTANECDATFSGVTGWNTFLRKAIAATMRQ
ncbi:MAG: ATP-binding protein [Thermoguttaceae bacterium]|jgi:PAS domain S-box-containing protein|nr:ATP-binding protein [Thermoguttaceae bacterium]